MRSNLGPSSAPYGYSDPAPVQSPYSAYVPAYPTRPSHTPEPEAPYPAALTDDVDTGRKGVVASVLVLLGAIVAVIASEVSWYSMVNNATNLTNGDHFQTSNSWGIFSQCTAYYQLGGADICGMTPGSSLGTLLQATGILMLLGIALAILGAILGIVLAFKWRPANRLPAALPVVLCLLATGLVIAAPILFSAAGPSAYGATMGAGNGPSLCTDPSQGPNTSFVGNCQQQSGSYEYNWSWGPSFGWYLAYLAFGLLLVGSLLLFRFRKSLLFPSLPPKRITTFPTTGGVAGVSYSTSSTDPRSAPVPPPPPY